MASVVNTHLLHVGNHSYRIRTQPIAGRPLEEQQYVDEEEDSGWQEEQATFADEDELIDESLISQEGGSYVTRISVDPQVLPHVIGKERRKQLEVEQATGAKLLIPKPRQHAGPSKQQHQPDPSALLGSSLSESITIRAPNKQALSAARTRVELLINSAINGRTLDYTHFVSLPLANEQTAAKLQEFQNQVLSQPGAEEKGFDKSIFINPKTLHLTLLMLKLYSDEARHKAKQVLQGMAAQVQELLAGKPLVLQIAGLDHMTDDPTDMHVLYLKVTEVAASGCLAALCDMIVAQFREAGLMVPGQPDTVKLHATIINTRHRRTAARSAAAEAATAAVTGSKQHSRPGSGKQQHQQDRVGFDGRELLQLWSGLDLGLYEVPAVHLSQRFAYDDSGYFACLDKLCLEPQ